VTKLPLLSLNPSFGSIIIAPYIPETPRIIEMEMIIEEKEIEVEPGVFVQAMTFAGTNPGPITPHLNLIF
jgi:hypothetical protein